MATCAFQKDEAKIVIGVRKVSCIRRPSKNPEHFSTLYYLPIHKEEAQRLGLTKDSLLKAEIAVLAQLDETA